MEQQTIEINGTEVAVYQTADEAKKHSEIVWSLCESEGEQYLRPAIVMTDVVGFVPVPNTLQIDIDDGIMRFMFITSEGYTYQPNSEAPEPDIENCQVIGYGDGETPEQAFDMMVETMPFLLGTTFDEVVAVRLHDEEHLTPRTYHHLSSKRKDDE